MTSPESTFNTALEIEKVLQIPLLAAVDWADVSPRTASVTQIDVYRYPIIWPTSRFSEAIKVLRTKLQMKAPKNPVNVIQLSSTFSGEGKSTLALSLGASAANSGLRVLLVDCALRHPSLSERLGLRKAHGLAELLMGNVTYEDVVQSSATVGCMVLPAGGKNDNPIDLFGSDRLASFFERAKHTFDYIVIDSPPAGRVIDPVIISEFSDKLVFVVKWGSTPQEAVCHAVRQLSRYKKVDGVVLNQRPGLGHLHTTIGNVSV